jgi:hypothetical protein
MLVLPRGYCLSGGRGRWYFGAFLECGAHFIFFLFGILLLLMEPVVTCICGQNNFCFCEFGSAQKALALFALLMSEGVGIYFLHELDSVLIKHGHYYA